MAQFRVVAHSLQVLCGMADGEIVHKYSSLLDRTLGEPSEFPKLEISQVLHTNPYPCAQNGQNQAKRTSRGPKQEQAEQSENGRHCIQHDHDLAMRQPTLEKLVMDVLTIGGEHRSTADKTTQHRKNRLQNWKAKRDHRNGNGKDRRRFLGALQGKCTQDETNEQAPAVTEKDRCRIKVKPEESDDRARQCDGQ